MAILEKLRIHTWSMEFGSEVVTDANIARHMHQGRNRDGGGWLEDAVRRWIGEWGWTQQEYSEPTVMLYNLPCAGTFRQIYTHNGIRCN